MFVRNIASIVVQRGFVLSRSVAICLLNVRDTWENEETKIHTFAYLPFDYNAFVLYCTTTYETTAAAIMQITCGSMKHYKKP